MPGVQGKFSSLGVKIFLLQFSAPSRLFETFLARSLKTEMAQHLKTKCNKNQNNYMTIINEHVVVLMVISIQL